MSGKTGLVCDDDQDIFEMLELLLEDEGYHVVPEQNSVNALKTIERESPDLILLDIWMPMISGDQILKSSGVNKQISFTPELMYSASTDGKTIAQNCGADRFISKPFNFNFLLEGIKSLLKL